MKRAQPKLEPAQNTKTKQADIQQDTRAKQHSANRYDKVVENLYTNVTGKE